jgi:hypothetical protein
MTTPAQGKYQDKRLGRDSTMARRDRTADSSGVSLAKGPVGIIGLVLLAYGVTGLIFGGNDFTEQATSGNVDGETWLGIEGNGWSNLLAIGAGGLLLFGAQLHLFAKAMAIIVGLGFAAAAIIAIIDGSDVLGIFAANGATKLAWAIAAGVLIAVALLPRVGRRRAEPETTTDEATAPAPATADTARFDRDRMPAEGGAISERRAERL